MPLHEISGREREREKEGRREEFNLIFPFSRSLKSRVFFRKLFTALTDSHLRAIPRAAQDSGGIKEGSGEGGAVRVSRKDRRFRAIFTKERA